VSELENTFEKLWDAFVQEEASQETMDARVDET